MTKTQNLEFSKNYRTQNLLPDIEVKFLRKAFVMGRNSKFIIYFIIEHARWLRWFWKQKPPLIAFISFAFIYPRSKTIEIGKGNVFYRQKYMNSCQFLKKFKIVVISLNISENQIGKIAGMNCNKKVSL